MKKQPISPAVERLAACAPPTIRKPLQWARKKAKQLDSLESRGKPTHEFLNGMVRR